MAYSSRSNDDASCVASKTATAAASPVERVARTKIRRAVEVKLWARAGARCEFRGCNEYLYEHPLTKEVGNFAEKAHIVAFRKRGPRGQDGPRPDDINSVDNLMLLCRPCHELIDSNPKRYPRSDLEAQKREHEDRIRFVTGFGPEYRTKVIKFTAFIGEFAPEIGNDEVFTALQPRYPSSSTPTDIDLVTGLGKERDHDFFTMGARRIDDEVRPLYSHGSELRNVKHQSVFALGPMPLLIALGANLSNKIKTDLYQCHRDNDERWAWHTDGAPVRYVSRCLRGGNDETCVALMLSLSGTLHVSGLPDAIDDRFSVYEITLNGTTPNRTYLRVRDDLEGFRAAYRNLLAELGRDHPGLTEIHLFPAAPAPVCVACGFDLLPKVDPSLIIYDNNKVNDGGFTEKLRVNRHER